ncbi:hypothetical protein Trydic_g16898 [Trypoxylus dichotomus]
MLSSEVALIQGNVRPQTTTIAHAVHGMGEATVGVVAPVRATFIVDHADHAVVRATDPVADTVGYVTPTFNSPTRTSPISDVEEFMSNWKLARHFVDKLRVPQELQ